MKIRSLIGFFMALRTGTEEDSREAIGSLDRRAPTRKG